MIIKFVSFTKVPAENCAILAQDVKGLECVSAGAPSLTDLDYSVYLPANTFISTSEVYANGARNLFVRDCYHGFSPAIGVLLVRPG